MTIHILAAEGNLEKLRVALSQLPNLEELDASGQTALMVAAASPNASVDVLRLLLESGANVNANHKPVDSGSLISVLGVAAKSATLDKIRFLVESGADVRYLDPVGYSLLLHAVYRRCRESTEEHLAMLEFLIASGAPLDAVSSYGESVLSVVSHECDLAKISFFLKQGANPKPLGWSPLHFAAALGDRQQVEALLDQGASLEERDRRERTPFLLSVNAGRLDIAQLLFDRGSDRTARSRCGITALMLAVERNDVSMANWLISEGWSVEEPDEFGCFPLLHAVENNAADCVAALLQAGANSSRLTPFDREILESATSREIVELLVAAEADLSDVNSEMRSQLTGIELSGEIDVSEADYRRYRNRSYGRRNPETMNNPFWNAMVRARAGAYTATSLFNDSSVGHEPAWCFQRFGQSFTQLPDGRYVEIGGEHEDYYDADFCIYNDVVVHHGNGTFDILGYPEDQFLPTDFHSATYREPFIYIIGNLSYPHLRRPGETPVYRLHCKTWRIEKILTSGEAPGWIHGHKARLVSEDQIEICGGKIVDGTESNLIENTNKYIFDLTNFSWRIGAK